MPSAKPKGHCEAWIWDAIAMERKRTLDSLHRLEMAITAQRGDHALLFIRGNVVVEGQTKQPRAQILGHGTVRGPCRKLPSRGRKMQRNVVEDRQDAIGFQVRNHSVAEIARRQNHVKHMVSLFALERDYRQSCSDFLSPVRQKFPIDVPYPFSLLLDGFP